MLGKRAEEVTGRGAGLSSEGLQRKIRVIRQALEKNRPDPGDVLDVVAKVGGYDIAGMCGLFLGGQFRSNESSGGLERTFKCINAVELHKIIKQT